MSKLSVLVGQELIRVEAVHDYYQLHFTSCLMTVFNYVAVAEQGERESSPRAVASIHECEDGIKIVLTDESVIDIDLRPPAWKGPEALNLDCGDGVVVWM